MDSSIDNFSTTFAFDWKVLIFPSCVEQSLFVYRIALMTLSVLYAGFIAFLWLFVKTNNQAICITGLDTSEGK